MLVSRAKFRSVQEDVRRLQRELEEAHASLARYQDQERELVDAVVAARVEARLVRSRAEDEAGEVIGGARDEAVSIKAEARAQMASAQAEIARLHEVQRELSTSLEQSLAMLHSVLSHTALPQPAHPGVEPGAVAQTASPAKAPDMPTVDAARLAPITAARQPRPVEEAVPSPVPPAPIPARRQGTPAAARPQSFSVPRVSGRSRRAWPAHARSLVRVGAIALVCLAVLAGGFRWWRGSAGRSPTAAGISLPLGPEDAAASTTVVRSAAPPAVSGAGGLKERDTRGVRVEVKAVRPVWLRAQVDGRDKVARLVRAGENLEFKAANDVVLRAGDAGALLMSVDGGPLAAFGVAGAVLTRRVAADRATRPQRPAPSDATAAAPGSSTAARPLLPRPDAPALPTPVSEARSHTMVPDRRIGPPEQIQAASQPAPAAAPAPVPAVTGGSDEGDVLRAHEAYFEALRRGDQGQVGRLAADGFSMTGAPAADESGMPYEITLRNASVEIRGVGAVVSGTASQRINGPDGQFLRNQQLLFSEVWIRRDGQWQLMNVRLMSPGAAR